MKGGFRVAVPVALGIMATLLAAFLAHPSGGASADGLVAEFSAPQLGGGNAYGVPTAYERRTISPEFNSPLALGTTRRIAAVGPFGCTVGENWSIDVAITQGRAVATGNVSGRCRGKPAKWRATAVAVGPDVFRPGRAVGHATFRLTKGRRVTDTFSWAERVVLRRR